MVFKDDLLVNVKDPVEKDTKKDCAMEFSNKQIEFMLREIEGDDEEELEERFLSE